MNIVYGPQACMRLPVQKVRTPQIKQRKHWMISICPIPTTLYTKWQRIQHVSESSISWPFDVWIFQIGYLRILIYKILFSLKWISKVPNSKYYLKCSRTIYSNICLPPFSSPSPILPRPPLALSKTPKKRGCFGQSMPKPRRGREAKEIYERKERET